MAANYQLKMEELLADIRARGEKPRLLLHSCCAPCSSAVLERLTPYFRVTVYYFNPNITPRAEFEKRAAEQRRLLRLLPQEDPVLYIEGPYDRQAFEQVARGREEEPEGGVRCALCYELRLRRTAQAARDGGYGYFATTLSVSPYKHAQTLNEIGAKLSAEYGVPWLYADFKKKDGYLRSIRLSQEFHLYRQNYCGCQSAGNGPVSLRAENPVDAHADVPGSGMQGE